LKPVSFVGRRAGRTPLPVRFDRQFARRFMRARGSHHHNVQVNVLHIPLIVKISLALALFGVGTIGFGWPAAITYFFSSLSRCPAQSTEGQARNAGRLLRRRLPRLDGMDGTVVGAADQRLGCLGGGRRGGPSHHHGGGLWFLIDGVVNKHDEKSTEPAQSSTDFPTRPSGLMCHVTIRVPGSVTLKPFN
jgi:hypothetical protein